MDMLSDIKARMQRQGLGTALHHLKLAEGALDRREWESANSQVRSCLESLFNSVARIRLGSNKTGGNARKELESKGILREPEARLVQQFFRVAGGAGSHAGTSNEDEAQGRFFVGLGICLLGLALIPELTRFEDVLTEETKPSEVLIYFGNDMEIHTSCPSCGEEQTLANCEVRRDGDETVHECWNGCQAIIIIGGSDDSSWSDRGTPWGNRVVRNAADLHVPGYSKETGEYLGQLTLDRNREALMKREPVTRKAIPPQPPYDLPRVEISDFLRGEFPAENEPDETV
jgi:hypothetical protein